MLNLLPVIEQNRKSLVKMTKEEMEKKLIELEKKLANRLNDIEKRYKYKCMRCNFKWTISQPVLRCKKCGDWHIKKL